MLRLYTHQSINDSNPILAYGLVYYAEIGVLQILSKNVNSGLLFTGGILIK